MALRIERYGNTRHWAVYDEQGLVVVTLYKRGAREVQRRLTAQPRAAAEAAAQAAVVEAAARQAQTLACAGARPGAGRRGHWPRRPEPAAASRRTLPW
jgi:hypothetical protein